MNDINNIFPQGNSGKQKLSEDKLMAYLDGKLSPAEQHEVELCLADEGMESDAIDGLRMLTPGDTKHTISKLKHGLGRTILNKKRRRKPLNTGPFTWIAIAIILLLAVVAYIVIRIAK